MIGLPRPACDPVRMWNTLADPTLVKNAAPKAIPVLKRLLPLCDELLALDDHTELRQTAPMMKITYQRLLKFFEDEIAGANPKPPQRRPRKDIVADLDAVRPRVDDLNLTSLSDGAKRNEAAPRFIPALKKQLKLMIEGAKFGGGSISTSDWKERS